VRGVRGVVNVRGADLNRLHPEGLPICFNLRFRHKPPRREMLGATTARVRMESVLTVCAKHLPPGRNGKRPHVSKRAQKFKPLLRSKLLCF